GVGGGNARPLVNAGAEHFGPADEVAGMPIGQCYLAPLRRGIKYPDPAALDQIDSIMLGALREQRLAAVEHLAAALLEHQLALAGRELLHQRRGAAYPLLALR